MFGVCPLQEVQWTSGETWKKVLEQAIEVSWEIIYEEKRNRMKSQDEVLVVKGWVWKGVGSWPRTVCPRTHSLMALMSNLMESRKPASKNSKSCFTKSLKNTKAQITLLTDCSNSVSQKGRGGDFAFLRNLVYLAIPTKWSSSSAPGAGWIPRETLLPTEGETSESSRFCHTLRVRLRHTWGHTLLTFLWWEAWDSARGLEVLCELSGAKPKAFRVVLVMMAYL